GRIVYQYASITALVRDSATIGIQNAGRDTGLQVAFDATYVHDGLAVRFTPPARFLTVTPGTGTIAPGAFTDLRLRFNAAGLLSGVYQAAMRLAGNDPRVPVFLVPTRLDVLGVPDLATPVDTLDFGLVDIGYPQVQQLPVHNPGSEPLLVRQILNGDGAFAPRVTTLSIPPFGSALLDVRFAPVRAQPYLDALVLRSNDPDKPAKVVVLQGVGHEPPDVVLDGASLLSLRLEPGQTAAPPQHGADSLA